MSDDAVIDRQHEIQARAIVCRAYARALEDRLLDAGSHALAREYASRIINHQTAIEQTTADLVFRCQSFACR